MRHLFNQELPLQRKVRTSDDQGGWTESWTSLPPVLCRVRPASASERTIAAQEQVAISHIVYCDASEDIRRNDRIGEFDVVQTKTPSKFDHHLVVEVTGVQRGR